MPDQTNTRYRFLRRLLRWTQLVLRLILVILTVALI
jgi:hypothetical protein